MYLARYSVHVIGAKTLVLHCAACPPDEFELLIGERSVNAAVLAAYCEQHDRERHNTMPSDLAHPAVRTHG